jgi:hypothetical protein
MPSWRINRSTVERARRHGHLASKRVPDRAAWMRELQQLLALQAFNT